MKKIIFVLIGLLALLGLLLYLKKKGSEKISSEETSSEKISSEETSSEKISSNETSSKETSSVSKINRTFTIPENLDMAHTQLIRRMRPDVDKAFSTPIDVARWYFDYGVKEFNDEQKKLIATQPTASDLNENTVTLIKRYRPDVASAFSNSSDIKNWYVEYGIRQLSQEQLNEIRQNI